MTEKVVPFQIITAGYDDVAYSWAKVYNSAGDIPEKMLMRALLKDQIALAIHDSSSAHSNGGGIYHSKEILSARQWIKNEEKDWLFSFCNICDVLGLEATKLRHAVLNNGLMVGKQLRAWEMARGPRKVQKNKYEKKLKKAS